MTAASLAFLISGTVFAGFIIKKVKNQLTQGAKGDDDEPIAVGPYGAQRSFSGVLSNNDSKNLTIDIDGAEESKTGGEGSIEFNNDEQTYFSSAGCEEYG